MQQDREEKKCFTAHVPISRLILDKNNPRKINKKQFEKLIESLKTDPDFLEKRPILVNRITIESENLARDSLYVYAGTQRVKAAKRLSWKQIPCIIDDNLSEEIIKQRIIKDNAHYGEHDWDILANDFDIETLLMAGLTENDLQLKFDVDTETTDKDTKKKKPKQCPHCGLDI
jgi:ParB-like chromosome segregation protein Spo0J